MVLHRQLLSSSASASASGRQRGIRGGGLIQGGGEWIDICGRIEGVRLGGGAMITHPRTHRPRFVSEPRVVEWIGGGAD